MSAGEVASVRSRACQAGLCVCARVCVCVGRVNGDMVRRMRASSLRLAETISGERKRTLGSTGGMLEARGVPLPEVWSWFQAEPGWLLRAALGLVALFVQALFASPPTPTEAAAVGLDDDDEDAAAAEEAPTGSSSGKRFQGCSPMPMSPEAPGVKVPEYQREERGPSIPNPFNPGHFLNSTWHAPGV